MGEYTNISRRELYPKQMAAVNKALEIDDRLSEAHISLAISLMLNEWDWNNSQKEFKIGIELNPKYANGRHWYAEWLLFMGKTSEAFREISTAVDLDPVSQGILKDKGIFYYYTRQYNRAIDMAHLTLELNPNFAPAYRLLSLSYQGMKLYDEAIAENTRWGEHTGNEAKTNVALADIYAAAGRREDAEKLVKEIETDKKFSSNDYRGMAQVHAALGNIEAAFSWLEKSYQHHEESLCSLKIDPKMEPLHSDPRFKKLLKKVGLEQ
jgi:tetratricopeptide (TPR) repeat protein